MSSVFVLGATGSIGIDVSLSFLNHGFKVYGLARNQEKADYLISKEIIPVIGSASDVDVWGPIVEKVDVVIEAIADFSNPQTAQTIFNKLKEITAKRPSLLPIYTSGTLVYGATDAGEFIDENTTYKPTLDVLLERIKLEEKYRAIGGVVIQPSFVYGRAGSGSGLYFRLATKPKDGVVSVFGTSDQYRSFVHSYDLAQLYLLAALKSSISRGQTYIASVNYFKTEEVIRAMARAANVEVKSVVFTEPPKEDFLANLLAVSSVTVGKKAMLTLGWNPQQPSIIDDTQRYYNAWNLSKPVHFLDAESSTK
ncbi:hypothetical protein PPL_00824 [Heterostelium album PN500]|uniref:NAD-dependent epimerase/dehydratase domain-containing protein n=1 Tax=Heterostelium pallidum (strain ATCC 26659 / Pp 5 / PN500) TaxID=670386 RepID=D3AXJ3_HETP5|nr:hypothetical protein PPL_00824 [Heterostelium album PN500]EFA86262.1 hypothetical protein PPL_00824 [Heterostelium album PN500]|eukprot:XP_020438367.1 hypothetical protein PPL_00824 [Heterostelium album PN500]